MPLLACRQLDVAQRLDIGLSPFDRPRVGPGAPEADTTRIPWWANRASSGARHRRVVGRPETPLRPCAHRRAHPWMDAALEQMFSL